jgi:hypothetical protein
MRKREISPTEKQKISAMEKREKAWDDMTCSETLSVKCVGKGTASRYARALST